MNGLLRPAFSLLALMTVVTGLMYPMLINGLANMAFPGSAGGAIIERDGKPVGSALIGQNFTSPGYFWGRPSATAPQPNNAMASAGSNLGPSNPALVDAVKARVEALTAADPQIRLPIPADLVLSSASVLDPDISVDAALFQVGRVARARDIPEEKVTALVQSLKLDRQWGLFGEPRVNVLALNLALDAMTGK